MFCEQAGALIIDDSPESAPDLTAMEEVVMVLHEVSHDAQTQYTNPDHDEMRKLCYFCMDDFSWASGTAPLSPERDLACQVTSCHIIRWSTTQYSRSAVTVHIRGRHVEGAFSQARCPQVPTQAWDSSTTLLRDQNCQDSLRTLNSMLTTVLIF